MFLLLVGGKGRKKRDIDLGPLDAKCFCELEICCRHPDWKDVPMKVEYYKLTIFTNNEIRRKEKECKSAKKTTTTVRPKTKPPRNR